jgi:hypothetical protein
MAEKRTIEIDIKNNAPKTEQDFKNLNSTMDSTAKANDQVNRSFNTGATFAQRYGEELQPLTTRMGEAEDRLYELALAGDTTSKEYQELLTKVGEYRKVQMATDLAVDGASKTFIQKLAPALNGVTSAYLATQGALTLFGKENEELNETLVKVQGALAIQQGIQGLTSAYKELAIGTKLAGAAQSTFAFVTGAASTAMKVFRLALIGTGVGAIVIAVGALIANFDKIGPVVKKAINFALKPLKAIIDGIVASYYAVTDALGITSKAEREREKQAKVNAANAKKRAAREKKEAAQRQKELEKEIELQRQVAEAEQRRFDRKIRLLESEGKSTIRLRKQRARQALEEAKRLDRLAQEQVFFKNIYQGQVQEAQIAYNDILKEERDYYKQRRQNAEQFRKDQAEIDFGIVDEEIELLAELDKIRQENEARFKTEQQNELDEVERKYDKLEAMAYGNAEALDEIEIARLNEKNEIELKYQTEAYNNKKALEDKAEEDRKERDAKKREETQALNDFITDSALQTLDVVNQFAQLRADKFESLNQQILDNEELTDQQKEKMLAENNRKAKRAFEIQKAANIAQAVIATYQGANAIFASAAANPATVLFPAQPFIAAGLAVAGGLANVASISRQKFEGASLGGGGDTGAPDLGGGEAVAPQFNVVGDSSLNQLAQLQQQPTQAFVVSGEVTSAQALDRNRVTNATL